MSRKLTNLLDWEWTSVVAFFLALVSMFVGLGHAAGSAVVDFSWFSYGVPVAMAFMAIGLASAALQHDDVFLMIFTMCCGVFWLFVPNPVDHPGAHASTVWLLLGIATLGYAVVTFLVDWSDNNSVADRFWRLTVGVIVAGVAGSGIFYTVYGLSTATILASAGILVAMLLWGLTLPSSRSAYEGRPARTY